MIRRRSTNGSSARPSRADLLGAFNYAVCLAEGFGLPRNDERAAFWLKRAAEGVVDAQYWYGRMLADGRGVAQDEVQAAIWFTRAANAGMAEGAGGAGRDPHGWPRGAARPSEREILVSARGVRGSRRRNVRPGSAACGRTRYRAGPPAGPALVHGGGRGW